MAGEDSVEYKNSTALAAEIHRLHQKIEQVEADNKVRDNRALMLQTQITQLQQMFATQTVPRGAGSTTE